MKQNKQTPQGDPHTTISLGRVLGWIFSSVILLSVMLGGLYFHDALRLQMKSGVAQPVEGRTKAVVQVSPTPLQQEAELPVLSPTPESLPTPTPRPMPTASPTAAPYLHPLQGDVLEEGMEAPIAIDIQIQLMVLEYMDFDQPGEEYGAGAANAMALFQRRNGLPVTGKCDKATYEKLYSEDALPFALEKGDTGDEVQSIQDRLMELGYLSAPGMGVFDEETEDAVLRFCSKNGLEQTPAVSAEMIELLMGEKAVQNSYRKGETSPEIQAFQQRLLELGYLTYEADGNYGDLTVQAVKRFQDNCGLIADGSFTTATVQALLEEDAPLFRFEKGMSGADVRQLQKRLYKLGYLNEGDLSGKYDQTTVEAVKAFQQRNNLSADGLAGGDTLTALLSNEAEKAPAPKATATPKPTKKPEKTAKPTKTPKPEKTEKPASTPKPEKTPKPTSTPKPTKTPKPEKTPKPTKTPKPASTPELSNETPAPGGEDVLPTPTPRIEETPEAPKEPSPTPKEEKEEEKDFGTGVEALIAIAESKLGCKYVRGAKGPNTFDCSGFVYWCLNQAGMKVGYMTSIRWRTCDKFTRIESMKDLKRGDILVFSGKTSSSGHVGIYMGNGKMIDAGSSAGKVLIRKSIFTSYWEEHFLMGYRIWN